MMWKLLCFRFGIFVVFSLWLQGITWKTHHVTTSLIRIQRLLSFFEVSCPISCSLFLYRRNFSYPHKHNVIQTAEVSTALGWPWDEHELPPLALPCLGVTTAPSPHSSAGSEQHLQKKWLFLLFPAITGSLIATVFVSVPQCCLTREGWALLLPTAPGTQGLAAGCSTGSSSAPSFNPTAAAGCTAPWGIPAASMAQLHSQASCSACLRHPSPPSWCSHSQPWMNLTQRCLSRTFSSISSGSWRDAIVQPCSRLECGIYTAGHPPPDVLQCVQSTLQMLVYNLCQTTLNKFLQKTHPPLSLVQFLTCFRRGWAPSLCPLQGAGHSLPSR